MATFVSLISETEHGDTRIRDSVARANEFKKTATRFGATVKEQYWTMGAYDGVVIFDAPDDETAAALVCQLVSQGAVRTQTLRAFDADQMQSILQRSQA